MPNALNPTDPQTRADNVALRVENATLKAENAALRETIAHMQGLSTALLEDRLRRDDGTQP